MGEKSWDKIIIGRHEQRVNTDTISSDRPQKGDEEHPDYPGITESGVEHGTETTKQELLDIVNRADPDAIVFFGGSSEEIRTKSTNKLRGDILAKEFGKRDDVVVYTQEDMEKLRQEAKDGNGKVLNLVEDIIESNKDKKIIFTYPLFLKGLSLRPQFRESGTGKRIYYSKKLGDLSHDHPDKSVEVWLKDEGKLHDGEETIQGKKTPQQVAEEHMRDIQRLRNFTKRFSGDRQSIIGLTGHGWNEDALMVYLANRGKVDAEGFSELGSVAIKQGELSQIEFSDGEIIFHYRGQKYNIPEDKI